MNLLGVIRKNWGQLLTICGIFALMIVLSCLWAVSNARQYMTLNAEEMLQVAEERLQGRIRESEVTLFNTANSLIQQQLHRGFNAEETREYLREIHRELSHSEYNLGYFNIFWYMPRPEGMVFISGSDWEPPPEYEPEKRPWYFAADAIPGHSAITAPYIEWKEGINAVTMALRLRGGGGEDFGILGIDLSVARLAQFALSFQFERGGYGYLIGPSLEPDKLCFIAYPDSRYAGLPMRGLGPQYAALEERLKQGTEALSSVTLKNANNVPVIAFYRRTINGWYMGLAFPRDGYFHDLYVNIFVFVLSGIVLMLVLCYFIVNLSMDKLQSDEENQAKSSFLAQVSHEIRTPLNSILGMSEIILRKDISPDLYENVSIIRQSGDILLSIINNILDFSRIEIHRIQIENHPYQLSSMINDVVNIIRLGLAGKPVDFFVDVAGDIPVELLGDEAKVRQLLINLLNNAVKYTRQGYIKLLVRKGAADSDELRLLFSVEDTGIGIRQEDLGRLFRDFTRLDRERNSHIEGAGLGLAIAASFCKALGGGISVESVYGEGSIFTAEVRQGVGKGGTTLQLRESGMRVVVYEDRSLYLEFLLRAFNALGIDPESSPDLSSFVSALEGGDFDYAFVASRYAADCVAAWEGAASPAKLFVMAETDFDAGFRSAGRVHLPLYSCSLANILNGVPGPENNSRRTDRFAFMAPDARVLVVDDLSTNLRVAEELMRPYGMIVDTCLSGAEAIELARKNRYDLIFMDHMMPEMDGLAAAAAIRDLGSGAEERDYYRTLPIVMLTANAVAGQREMFLKNGIDGFLSKPIDTRKLNDVLEIWILHEKRRGYGLPEEGGAENDNSPVPVIPGLDTAAGLANSGGSPAAYRRILSVFCADADERIPQIQEAAASNNLKSYTIALHALKGVCRSIGAQDLGDLAAELEAAGRGENAGFIAEKTGRFIGELGELVGRVRAGLGRAEDAGGAEDSGAAPELSAAEAEALRDALLRMDVPALDAKLAEISGRRPGRRTRDLIGEIEQRVLRFEYEEAAELLRPPE